MNGSLIAAATSSSSRRGFVLLVGPRRLLVTKTSSSAKFELLRKKLEEGPDLKDFLSGEVEQATQKYAEQG